jgi:hypothetical protein
MPVALTARELDLIRASDAALDRFELAKTTRNAVEIAKARRSLEDISAELEKHRDPNAKALDLIHKSLRQPIDAATGALVKAKPVNLQRRFR